MTLDNAKPVLSAAYVEIIGYEPFAEGWTVEEVAENLSDAVTLEGLIPSDDLVAAIAAVLQ